MSLFIGLKLAFLVLLCSYFARAQDSFGNIGGPPDIANPGLSAGCFSCNQLSVSAAYTGASCFSGQYACHIARLYANLAAFTGCAGFLCNASSSESTASPNSSVETTLSPTTTPSSDTFSSAQRCGASSAQASCTSAVEGPRPHSNCVGGGAFYCHLSCVSPCGCGPSAYSEPTAGESVESAQLFGLTITPTGGSTIQLLDDQAVLISTPVDADASAPDSGAAFRSDNQSMSSLMITVIAIPSANQQQASTTAAPTNSSGNQSSSGVRLEVVPEVSFPQQTSTGSTPEPTAEPQERQLQLHRVWSLVFEPYTASSENASSNQSSGSSSPANLGVNGVAASQAGLTGRLCSVRVNPLDPSLDLHNARVEARLAGRLMAVYGLFPASQQSSTSLLAAVIPDGEWLVNAFFPLDNDLMAVVGLPQAAPIQFFGQPLQPSCPNLNQSSSNGQAETTLPPDQFETTTLPPDQSETTTLPPVQSETTTLPPDQSPPVQSETTTLPPVQSETTTLSPDQSETTTALPPDQSETTTLPPDQSSTTAAPGTREEPTQTVLADELVIVVPNGLQQLQGGQATSAPARKRQAPNAISVVLDQLFVFHQNNAVIVFDAVPVAEPFSAQRRR